MKIFKESGKRSSKHSLKYQAFLASKEPSFKSRSSNKSIYELHFSEDTTKEMSLFK